jgi:hypothetical protein
VIESSEPGSVQEQVLSGRNRNLQLLAAEGLLPLAPEELIPIQVKLTQIEDQSIAAKAVGALEVLDPRIIAPVLAHGAEQGLLEYFARQSDHPLVIETIIRLKEVPNSLLLELASRIAPELQEILILRQDAILAEPEILASLERNPYLTPAVRRRIGEYREHLFPRERPTAADEPAGEEDVASPAEVREAIEMATLEPFEGEVDEETGLCEGQIRTLPVPVRLQLSRGAAKTLRDILIRDSNPLVASSVLQNNSFSDGEIERVAAMRTVVEEVLDGIGRSSRWMRKYTIAHALARNPRTPIPMAVRVVPRLAVRDLRVLRRDRNVSEAVRQTANRIYLQKMQ